MDSSKNRKEFFAQIFRLSNLTFCMPDQRGGGGLKKLRMVLMRKIFKKFVSDFLRRFRDFYFSNFSFETKVGWGQILAQL